MNPMDVRVGHLLVGGFCNLAPHGGALKAWFDPAFDLPRPFRMVGGSAGAIMAAAMAPGTPENSERVVEVLRHLKRSKIFDIPLEKKISGTLAVGALSFPLISHLEPDMRPVARFILHVAQSVLGIFLGYRAVSQMFGSPSVFDNTPLEHLLTETLDFRAIHSSDVEVRIMATDIENGEHVAFSSHEAGLTLPVLVSYLLASSTLPIHFPIRQIGSRLLTDAEVKTTFPIGQLEDADVVFVFDYANELSGFPVPRTWVDHSNGMWNIMKAENTRKDLAEYERRRTTEPFLPEVVFLTTRRRIPPLELDSFRYGELTRSVAIGEAIIDENLEHIGEALGRAQVRASMRRGEAS